MWCAFIRPLSQPVTPVDDPKRPVKIEVRLAKVKLEAEYACEKY